MEENYKVGFWFIVGICYGIFLVHKFKRNKQIVFVAIPYDKTDAFSSETIN